MARSYRSIFLHVVFSTKERRPVLNAEFQPRLHAYLGGAIRGTGGMAIAVGGWIDHVHLLLAPGTGFVVEDFVKEIKRASNAWLRDEGLADGGFHWQGGYGAFSIARWDLDKVAAYVREQEVHHAKTSFADELRKLLERHGVEYDERFFLD